MLSVSLCGLSLFCYRHLNPKVSVIGSFMSILAKPLGNRFIRYVIKLQEQQGAGKYTA